MTLPRFPEAVYVALIAGGLLALVLPWWAQLLYVLAAVLLHAVAAVLSEEDDGWR